MADNANNNCMLNYRQMLFAKEYCVDFNATQAYIRAGYSPDGAGQSAHELLKNTEVQERIERRKEELAAAAEINEEWVLKQWVKLATADPNELTKLRRICCRYCHGLNGSYQWTKAQYTEALNVAIEAGKPAPDAMGGFGYDKRKEPNPECTECHGEGIEDVYFANSASSKAKGLFAGVKVTKGGIEVMTRDQDAALANISRFLGMSIDRKELSGPKGAPIAVANLKADDLSDDQLAALLANTGNDAHEE